MRRFCSLSREFGWSLYEFSYVLIIFCVLLFVGFFFLGTTVDSSKETLLTHQSAVFSRTMNTLHVLAISKHTQHLYLDNGNKVYFNSKFWPISVKTSRNKKTHNPLKIDCISLWQHLFEGIDNKMVSKKNGQNLFFDMVLINNSICRYKLLDDKEEAFFFDYHVSTGYVEFQPK